MECLTVQELIDKLKEMPSNLKVKFVIQTYIADEAYSDTCLVQGVSFNKDRTAVLLEYDQV